MSDNFNDKIKELEDRLQQLVQQQNSLNLTLYNLSEEINRLRRLSFEEKKKAVTEEKIMQPVTVTEKPVFIPEQKIPETKTTVPPQISKPKTPAVPAKGFEEFIGGNIAAKAGILVTIVGIFIGAKYAIDKNLISPVVRIILGYIAGIGLCATALWLKKKYKNYSAVLLGGGLAVLYFITYIAYSYYQLLPQPAAFAIMLLVTACAVYGSLKYNEVVIAHIGLVGAYAIPFLLSNNSGQYHVLFTYMAIINTGILAISLLRYWKSLFYAGFGLTWLIYVAWILFSYNYNEHYTLAWVFLFIFFFQFYACFLLYKLIKKEQYLQSDVIILLFNSFIFYGLGYSLFPENVTKNISDAGLFTLLNAAIHIGVAYTIKKLELADKALQLMIFMLGLAFITITIPVQFDGNWVTLLWAAESALLFYTGRTKQNALYERLSAALAVLAIISQAQDWGNYVSSATSSVHYFANIHFWSGLITAVFFGGIILLNHNKKFASALSPASAEIKFLHFALPVLFTITIFITGFLEIHLWTDKMFELSKQQAWMSYSTIILLGYCFIFLYVLSFIQHKYFKKETAAKIAGIIFLLLITVGLADGLNALGNLRDVYLHKKNGTAVYYFQFRYIFIMLVLYGLYACKKYILPYWNIKEPEKTFTLLSCAVILALLSSEYIHWMEISGSNNQYKLGLSILWGLYALAMIVLGIRRKKKILRLGGIALFGVTLGKLFFYDLTGLNTIAKTISFISLGLILLLVSYLYNRYKDVILMDDE